MTNQSDHAVGRLVSPLSLAQAATIVDAALAAGRTAGFEPLTVAVLDAGGHLIALKREDGSGILRPQIAIGKAWGALGMGVASRTLSKRLAERTAFQGHSARPRTAASWRCPAASWCATPTAS